MPSGGTSDYAPEMIHAAARGQPYECFVRPDTRIPFMAMPDGVDALVTLAAAPRERLVANRIQRRRFQSVRGRDSMRVVLEAFPSAQIDWDVDRQAAGDRRLMAGRCGRFGSAARLGLRAALRFRPGIPRVSGADDSKTVREEVDLSFPAASFAGLKAPRYGCTGHESRTANREPRFSPTDP